MRSRVPTAEVEAAARAAHMVAYERTGGGDPDSAWDRAHPADREFWITTTMTRWDEIQENQARGVPLDDISRAAVVAMWHDIEWLSSMLRSSVDSHIKITTAMRVGGRTPEKALDQMMAVRKQLRL